MVALLGFQILLGALTVLAKKAVIPTTAHVAVGALLFARLGSVMMLAPVGDMSTFAIDAVSAAFRLETAGNGSVAT